MDHREGHQYQQQSGIATAPGGGASETMFIPPGGVNQLSCQWGAVQLQITNNSSVALNVEVW